MTTKSSSPAKYQCKGGSGVGWSGDPCGRPGRLPAHCPPWAAKIKLLQVLCFFLRAENGVDGCAADGALTLEGWFTVLHGNLLRVLHFSFCFALDTIILISHGDVAS